MIDKRMIVKNSRAKAILFVDTFKNPVLSDLLILGNPLQHPNPAFQVFVHPGQEIRFCGIHKNCTTHLKA